MKGAALFLTLLFALSFCGLLTIYTSCSGTDSPLLLPGKQLLFLSVGWLLLWVMSRIRFQALMAATPYLAAAAFLSLFALRYGGISINGMRGWFRLGPLLFQPSELGKPFILLLFAWIAVRVRNDLIAFPALLTASFFWCMLIFIQPDFGGAIVYGASALTLYFACGGRLSLFLIPPFLMASALGFFLLRHDYALRRILGFLNPEAFADSSGWHIRQFQLATARGGWFGTGMDQAIWSNVYLPFAYNDSAFASLAETIGAVGGIAVIALYLAVALLLFSAAVRAEGAARVYLCGVGILWAFQSLLHIGVNVTILPTTGLTLPLVSYGGSSLCGWLLVMGAALSAARDGVENQGAKGLS